MDSVLIYDIQNFSIHNGKGIRTTIFFKGCPLDCSWCHNPESISFKKEMMIDKDKCINCGKCIDYCESARFLKNGNLKYKSEYCDFCESCTIFCINDCNQIVGKNYKINKLVDIILKDKSFYKYSSGGVTLSGGEALVFDKYISELIDRLKEHNINITIDTSGYVDFEKINKIALKVDTFLYDLKIMDNEKHLKYVGVENKKIISNLKKLSRIHKDIVIRIPLIKGVNSNDKNILKVIKLMNDLNLKKVDLLPYHSGGDHKRKKLGMKIYDFEKPNKKRVKEIKEMFESKNIIARIGG
ncbi:MAG: glycyl-radical enzyme activating protein [Bacillota bacterium]